MATKKIGDLQLRSDADDTINFAVDDTSQTWRVTMAQVRAFLQASANLITDRTADATPANDDLLLTSDTSASAALKKVKKSQLLLKSVISKTANFTASFDEDVYLVATAGGAVTATLPAASTMTGKILEFVKTDASANALIIDGNSSELVGENVTISLIALGDRAKIICDGSAWYVMSLRNRSEVYTRSSPNPMLYGSGSSNIGYFNATPQVNLPGSAITFAESSTLGSTWTINESGLYSASAGMSANTGSDFRWGISINSNQLTTTFESITEAHKFASSRGTSANEVKHCGRTAYLTKGDVLRFHSDADALNGGTGPSGSWMSVCKVG